MYVPLISTIGEHGRDVPGHVHSGRGMLFKLTHSHQRKIGRKEDGPNLVWMDAYTPAQCPCTPQPSIHVHLDHCGQCAFHGSTRQ